MADPRAAFYVPDDRQVIVYFEWEAPVGTHHCEGILRGPNGQLSVMSSFDYPAKQARFGGYWTIPLLENTPAGVWTFESRVDGESAGTLSFEIVAANRPAGALKEAPPTSAEIYQRAVKATVFIEKFDDRGKPLGAGSGFLLEDGLLLTAFRTIDGAHALRVALSDGRRLQSDSLLAWNRRQDWAVLKLPAERTETLKRTKSSAVSVGDHCYWLDVNANGARVIAEGQIVGRETPEGWGERLSISGIYNRGAIGSPVLDDQGEVLGLLGGAFPDIKRYDREVDSTATGSVVPLDQVSAGPDAKLTPLQTLWDTNQIIAPVTASADVAYGMMTPGKAQKGKPLPSFKIKYDFSPRDEFASIVIEFRAVRSWAGSVQMLVYDADNHVLVRADPVRIKLSSGNTQERAWSIPLTLNPGIYRADVIVGDEVAWREYFRLTE